MVNCKVTQHWHLSRRREMITLQTMHFWWNSITTLHRPVPLPLSLTLPCSEACLGISAFFPSTRCACHEPYSVMCSGHSSNWDKHIAGPAWAGGKETAKVKDARQKNALESFTAQTKPRDWRHGTHRQLSSFLRCHRFHANGQCRLHFEPRVYWRWQAKLSTDAIPAHHLPMF